MKSLIIILLLSGLLYSQADTSENSVFYEMDFQDGELRSRNIEEYLDSYSLHPFKPNNFLKYDSLHATDFVTNEKVKIIDNIISKNKTERSNSLKLNYRFKIQGDFQKSEAYRNNKYAGDRLKIYNRLSGKLDEQYAFNLLTEKDPGERLLHDHVSFNFSAYDLWFFKRIIVGDYDLELGQGLTHWSTYSFNGNSEQFSFLIKEPRRIIPYSGSDEFNYFRGVAAEFNFKDMMGTLFFSHRYFDASMDSSSGWIKSVSTDGYHRTTFECATESLLSENLFGASIDYTFSEWFHSGLILMHTSYNKPFPMGKSVNQLSMNLKWSHEELFLASEFSIQNKLTSLLLSLNIPLIPNASLITSYKDLKLTGFPSHSSEYIGASRSFRSFLFGASYGQKELLTNLSYTISSREDGTKGNELYAENALLLSGNLQLKTSYRYRNSHLQNASQKQNFRVETIYKINSAFRLKYRYDYVFMNDTRESGHSFTQDLQAEIFRSLKINGRISFFDSDSYYTALYISENDLKGSMGQKALYGKGIRWYLLLNYSPHKSISFSAKYAESYFPDLTSIGSGLEEIMNNLDNTFGLQIDLKF